MTYSLQMVAALVGRQRRPFRSTKLMRPHFLNFSTNSRRSQVMGDLKTQLNDKKEQNKNPETLAEFSTETGVDSEQGKNFYDFEPLFSSSELKSLKTSTYGSFIQSDLNFLDTNESGDYRNQDDSFSGGEVYTDLDIGLDKMDSLNTLDTKSDETRPNSNSHQNYAFYKSKLNNPIEGKQNILIRKSYNKKKRSVTFEDFYGEVFYTQDKIIDFEFQAPIFPENMNRDNLLQYLREINLIDLRYDLYNTSRVIYLQLVNLTENLRKLDGIWDIDILHECIKFYGSYSMNTAIMKMISESEKIGVLPSNNTLHLLLYQLENVKNYNSREKLINFYLKLAILRWGITTELMTKSLVYRIKKPSKSRLALGRMLVSEGFAFEDLKWYLCADYTAIELERKNGEINFSVFKKFLAKEGLFNDTYYDEILLFDVYIKELVEKGLYHTAIMEINKATRLNLTECWLTIIDNLIERDEYWLSLAVFNFLKNDPRRDEIEMRRIAASYINQQLEFYKFFMQHPPLHVRKRNQDIFLGIMKIIQRDADVRLGRFDWLVNNLSTESDVNDEIDEQIAEEFEQICILQVDKSATRQLEVNFATFPWILETTTGN